METKIEMDKEMRPEEYISMLIDNKDIDKRSRVNRFVEKLSLDPAKVVETDRHVKEILKRIKDDLENGKTPKLNGDEVIKAKAWIIMRADYHFDTYFDESVSQGRTVKMMKKSDIEADGAYTIMDEMKKKQPDVFTKVKDIPIDETIDIDEISEKSIEHQAQKRLDAKNKAQEVSQKMSVLNQMRKAQTPNMQVQMKSTKPQSVSSKGKVIDTMWRNGYAEYNGKPIMYDPYDGEFMMNKVQKPSRKVAIPLKMRIVGEDRESVIAIPLIDQFTKQKAEHDQQRDERRKTREEEERKELEELRKKAFEATVILFDERVRLYTENEQYKDKILVMSRERKAEMITHQASRGTWLIGAVEEQVKNDGQNLVYVRLIEQVKTCDLDLERQLKLKIFGVEEAEFEGYIYAFKGKLTVTSTMKDPEKDIYIPARYRNSRQIKELNLPDILTNMGRWKLKFHHLNEKDNTIVVDPKEYLGRYEDNKQSEN